MKPKEKKPEEIYRIIHRATGNAQGSYSRACCDEYDFGSPQEARSANCHGMFADKTQFAIAKYRVTYELMDEDVDPPDENDVLAAERRQKNQDVIKRVMEILPKHEKPKGQLPDFLDFDQEMKIHQLLKQYLTYLEMAEKEIPNEEALANTIASFLLS